MASSLSAPFRLGPWAIDPRVGTVAQGDAVVRIDDRALRVLACLAAHAGEVVSVEALLQAAWPDVVVGSDSVYQAIATLRRALGDAAREPAYIATVARQGYRLVAPVVREEPAPQEGAPPPSPVSTPAPEQDPPPPAPRPPAPRRRPWLAGVAAALAVAVVAVPALEHRAHPGVTVEPPLRSIAVLPFEDLTDSMDKEPFADGMTEQLIETLGEMPGVQVPSRTASFALKGQHVPIADAARALHVSYLLEGSVRQSGRMVRVTTRLVRARDGYLLWSQDYDRPSADALAIQDDIAAKVAAALRECWEANEAPESRR